jgi:hypothetical protein
MVARHYWTGGSGHFSDIVFYSVVDGKKHGKKLHVHRTILLGDRAVDGMLSHPIFDSKGKIYFYMHLSNATLLKAAGLDEKIFSGNDGFTCCACYEIVGKCVYDIEKEKMEILSMIAFSDENQNSNSIPSQNSKIKSLLQSKMHSGSAIFNEKETKEFLKKLRKICSM